MKANISSVTAGDNVNISQEIISQAAFGLTVSATPFTSYVIPANTLKAGLVYRLAVNFDAALVLDTTTISGSGIVGMYSAATVAYIAGQSSTSIAPPIIATQTKIKNPRTKAVTRPMPEEEEELDITRAQKVNKTGKSAALW